MNDEIFYHRYLGRFIVELMSPLTIGSGKTNLITDQTLALDANRLPYIPGTALAGVLRHLFVEDDHFGNTDLRSRLIFTEAKLIGKDGRVLDGRPEIDFTDDYYKHFENTPVRQHVCISEKGTAQSGGVFDHEIVPCGSRFCFEIEMQGTQEDQIFWNNLIAYICNNDLHIGSKTRSGFGWLRIVECRQKTLNLKEQTDLDTYIEKSSELNDEFWGTVEKVADSNIEKNRQEWHLNIRPECFFLFSSGQEDKPIDEHVDFTPREEPVIRWKNGLPTVETRFVIPASSIKGALSHRTAFHYNLLKERYINCAESCPLVGSNNEAVKKLFGYVDGENACAGTIYISDIYLDKSQVETKKLSHVAIDRFTGGAIDGALFSEQVLLLKEGQYLKLDIIQTRDPEDSKSPTDKDVDVDKAFACAIEDLCNGMLPLGGGVNRGNGVFMKEKEENERQ